MGSGGALDASQEQIPGGMGGREANARLEALDPEARTIAASGDSNDPVLADHGAYGFDGVLAEPYTARGVSQVLDRCRRGPRRRLHGGR